MARSILVGDAKKEKARAADRHSALLVPEAQENTLDQGMQNTDRDECGIEDKFGLCD
jgi:hypothetical protein